jgi:hypothetical protein
VPRNRCSHGTMLTGFDPTYKRGAVETVESVSSTATEVAWYPRVEALNLMTHALQYINSRLFANIFVQYLNLKPHDRRIARDAVARYHGAHASPDDRAEALESLRKVLHPAAGPAIEAQACLAIAAHDERDC